MKKSITFFSFLFLFVVTISAQQSRQTSQFFLNKLVYNPSFAGVQGEASLGVFTQNEYIGTSGGLQTQTLSFDTPFGNQKNGFGTNIVRHRIAAVEFYTFDVAYAHNFSIGSGKLGIGVQTTANLVNITTLNVNEDNFLPNFGLGVNYTRDNFYVGISMPQILRPDNFLYTQARSLYGMMGVLIPINDKLKLQPQAMVTTIKNAPLSIDLNMNLILLDRFTAGATYHTGINASGLGESISLLLATQIFNRFSIGLSHDIILSTLESNEIRNLSVSLRYNFGKLDVE